MENKEAIRLERILETMALIAYTAKIQITRMEFICELTHSHKLKNSMRIMIANQKAALARVKDQLWAWKPGMDVALQEDLDKEDLDALANIMDEAIRLSQDDQLLENEDKIIQYIRELR